jgi:hypothetical protein
MNIDLIVQRLKVLHMTLTSRQNNRFKAFPFWEMGKYDFPENRKSRKISL